MLFASPPPPPPTPTPMPVLAAPSRSHGAAIARVTARTPARSKPAGGAIVWLVPPETGWGNQPQRLLVLASADVGGVQWLRVRLPLRDDHAGWIPRDAATITTTRYWIDIHTSTRRVTVSYRGRRVRRWRAVVGAPATPTPTGLAAIYERARQPDPRGFLGGWALHLTALSNVLLDFGGGPGRIAIHGRGAGSLRDPLGTARSHGCVRIDNRAISWIARHVPTGTPVRITRR